ncbi:MAG: lipid IV(A) 3-deoxy-D-manno-octulosonic acid transferase [Pseudomonadota bacterium]|nr:lipid IV(A) 3-deoxy-D-manno-octulosonic acid transferase [Pseudomonadota bacterium]
MFAADKNGYKPTFIEDVCRWIYSSILTLLIPFAFLQLMLRSKTRNKDYNHRRFERFGFVATPAKSGGYLFHCVSVGEVVAASCLIKRIIEDEPEAQITITTTTPTGSARVKAIFGDKVHHFYLPYDLHMAMAGMLKRVKPKAVLITEVELWPNLIHACWKREIPVMVINARMTDRSARRYKKIGKLFNPMLEKLNHICAQGERDFKNYAWLGVPSNKLTLTNNIKFDQVASLSGEKQHFLGLEHSIKPILVAGSTHEPEETTILDAVQRLWTQCPSMRVVIVPRHPERFDVVAKILEKRGLSFVRSSQVNDVADDINIVLLDEMGKLNHAYSVATFAFVGGSIADRGGHNALEPAAFSIPIMMGPHTYNNPVICGYLQERGALSVVEDAQQIADKLSVWLSDPDKRSKAGKAGRDVLDENSGALETTLTCIKQYLQ